MTGIPSIVAGLFAYALFAIFFGPGIRIGFCGSVALSVLMIPVVVRSTRGDARARAERAAGGVLRPRRAEVATIVKVVLPTSLAGIITGIMLAVARVIGETAPLLIVAGFTDSMNYDLFSGRMQTLPVFVYTQYASPGSTPRRTSTGPGRGALALILIVMLLNLVARIIAKVFAPKTGR